LKFRPILTVCQLPLDEGPSLGDALSAELFRKPGETAASSLRYQSFMRKYVMKRTQGEVEAQISSDLSKFCSELFGRGPKHIQVNMLSTSAVVVMQNNFNQAEKQILLDGRQQNALKNMRSGMIESKLVALISIIENATEVIVKCMHHDLNSDEESFIFSLQGKPEYRLNQNGNGRPHYARI